jgi:hypothetical protein
LDGLKTTLMVLCRRESSGAITVPYAEAEQINPKDQLHGEDQVISAGPIKVLRYVPYVAADVTRQ